MRIAIIDDYQDAVRSLACFARLAGHDVTVFRDSPADAREFSSRFAGYDAIVPIRERSLFTAERIALLPDSVRLVSLTGPATGQIDVGAASRRGIRVCAGRGSGSTAAELTWALVLAATWHLAYEDRRLRDGHWQSTLGRSLVGRTLGIIGYGRIGSTVAGYGAAFGMRVVCWGRDGARSRASRDGVEFAIAKEAVFEQSDVVSLHLPLNPSTRGIVTGADLALMKPDALIVNTARAGLFTSDALVDALRAGRPGAAALDVFDAEPLPATDPLLQLPNVVCTPHLGYVTREAYETMFGDAFDNLLAFAAGNPINVVPAPAA